MVLLQITLLLPRIVRMIFRFLENLCTLVLKEVTFIELYDTVSVSDYVT